jgi:hypothetical protein
MKAPENENKLGVALNNLISRGIINKEDHDDCYIECVEALEEAGYIFPEHIWGDCNGTVPPFCVNCGCDEDDAFVGGEECK